MISRTHKILIGIFAITLCGIFYKPTDAAVTDTVSGATHAYSLRKVKASYTNPLVRIRRTGNDQADVYPDAQGNFSSSSPITVVSGTATSTILSQFATSTTNAVVSIWYDQIGTSDVSQASTTAQPSIIASGVILTTGPNQRPQIYFNGSSSYLESTSTITMSQPFTIFTVSTSSIIQGNASARMIEIGNNPNRALYQPASGMYAGTFLSSSIQLTWSTRVMTMLFATPLSQLWVNGNSTATGGTGTNVVNGGVYIGNAYNVGTSTNFLFKGAISEILIYDSALTDANRQIVEFDERDYYVVEVATTTPTVTIQSASSLLDSSAVLNGSITNTGGGATTIASTRGFNFGTTTAYGSTITATGTFSTGSFSLTATGLTCNTLYHAQAFAINGVGTATSSDTTFTTGACPTSSTALGVSNAKYAYGLRQLVPSYVGPLIKIRRTGNDEADVYADASGYLSSSSPVTVTSGVSTSTVLSDFVSGVNAVVKVWYDQSGNALNMQQATTSVQPAIVTNGSLITSGSTGRAAINFNGSNHYLAGSMSASINQPFTVVLTNTADVQTQINSRLFEMGITPNRALFQYNGADSVPGGNAGMYAGTFLTPTTRVTPHATEVSSMVFNSANSEMYVNGVNVVSGNAGSNTVSGTFVIGSNVTLLSNFFYKGTISEFIVYNGVLSDSDRQKVESNMINALITPQTSALRITSPARSVAASSSVATISYSDQKGNTVYIPYIQTSTTLNVSAGIEASSTPVGGGVKFVLNQGLSTERVGYDMAAPYNYAFTSLAKGTYVLDAYVVDSGNNIVAGASNHDQATNIGIGDIYIAIGDSITKGAGGIASSSCIASGELTDWTQALPGTVSSDGRNYCQWSMQQPQYFKSWMPELNNELTAYNNYPVFILNEGYGGYTAAGYGSSPMASTTWNARINSLHPNKWFVLLGTNDNTSTTTLVANINTIATNIKNNFGAPASSIYLGLPLYAGSRPDVQTYIQPLKNLVTSGGYGAGPNFNSYFFEHPELYIDTPPIHPTPTGYTIMSRLWALSLISPKNTNAVATETGATISWDNLATFDAIPTGTSEIAGYNVRYGTTSGNYTATVDAGNTLSTTLTGLTLGQTYYYTVQAYGASTTLTYSATSTEKTFVPAATPVTPTPTRSSGGGGGSTSGTPYVAPTTASSTETTVPVYTCNAETKTCVITYVAVQTPTSSNTTTSSGILFPRDLKANAKGNDVLALQQFLNRQGFTVAKSGAGSKGKETTLFGPATKNALIRFQKYYKIYPSVGFFGPLTKQFIKTKFGVE
ncbi:MAG: peptidoglycan-binding protein [Patescibacteria group bacterium]